jgi:zinc knuckle protein
MNCEPGQQFVLLFRFDSKPAAIYEEYGWPETPEENLERLKSCGREVDRKVMFCKTCNEVGHTTKRCKQERDISNRVVIRCFNCEEEGHRSRDCKQPRVDRRKTCRNCNQAGHMAAECTEPRSADNVERRNCGEGSCLTELSSRLCSPSFAVGHFSKDCPTKEDRGPMTCRKCNEEGHMARDCTNAPAMVCRNCNQEGHMSRECTEPKNMANMTCRNCDEVGHSSRECPKPRDYSRVQCRNCGECKLFANHFSVC